MPVPVEIRRLFRRRSVVHTLAFGEVAGVAELALLVALDAVNRFTVSALAWLLFLWVSHGICGEHSTTRPGK